MTDTRLPYVYCTRGVPASGKTQWAHAMADKYPGLRTVSMDDLRATVDRSVYTKANEASLNRIQEDIVLEAVDAGRDIIVHNTHGYAKIPNNLRRLTAIDAEVAIVDFTDVPLQLCLERDAARTGIKQVGPDVINRIAGDISRGRKDFKQWTVLEPDMADIMLGMAKPKAAEYEPIIWDDNLPTACIVDLDGTLAIHNGRGPYAEHRCAEDVLNDAVATAARAFPHIIFCSGRTDNVRSLTSDWLLKHGLDGHLLMRKAGDTRADSIIKMEIFEEHIRGNANIAAVFDDRAAVVRMWRKLGLPCWQVAPGRF